MELFTKCSRCGCVVEQYENKYFPGIACFLFDSGGGVDCRPGFFPTDKLFYGSEAASKSHVLCPTCIDDLLKWLDCSEGVASDDEV